MQSKSQIYCHLTWSAKYRLPIIEPKSEKLIFRFIRERFKQNDCSVLELNGIVDHIHCLIRMPRDKSIVSVVKDVKGSSSFYINKNGLSKIQFKWQNGYWAASVDVYRLEVVRNYIRRQKQHHPHPGLNLGTG